MDYVPNQRNARYQWYKNVSANVVAEAAKFGAPAADATAAKALADGIIAKMEATDAADTAAKGARQIERTTEAANLAQLRAKARNWKTLSGFPASGSEAVLKLKGAEAAFDPTTYKPVIKVSIEAGRIKVEFEKRGVDGVAVYSRRRGEAQWRRIGTDTDSPYFDTGALAQPNVPEVREYMARGLIGDEEVGLDSDSVSITFAG
ncbi:MAG: hypothetical protein HYY24_02365 [Verrucomicrobia bacterium]|nr:hypothetical protein [Verrucomicrobiota bacterium]